MKLTQKRLKELLHYDPRTGLFTWRVYRGGLAKEGSVAGGLYSGYTEITVDYKRYKASRLAWFYMTGVWPKNEIDHINHITTDDWYENLRDATRTEQLKNLSLRSDNTSGLMGVHYRYTNRNGVKMYEVNIGSGKDHKYLGVHRFHKAKAIRLAAEAMEGYHKNHGKTPK